VFFIVNKTKKHIALPDIKISLGPRQAIDLDRIMDRSESEKSRCLRSARVNGDIEIRIKDGERKREKVVKVKPEGPDMGKMKEDIISEIKSLKLAEKSSDSLSREDLMDAMRELLQSMPAKEVIIKEGKSIASDEEIVDIDEDLLADINVRAVNKMIENVESGEVKYKEEKQKNDLEDNVDELEQLLG